MTDTLTVNLTVTANPGSPRLPLSIPKDVSPSNLRKLVSEATKIPSDKLRLIFRGRLIGNDDVKKAVEEFKLEEGTVLHCMGKPEGQATATSAASTAAAPAAAMPATAGSSVTIQPTAAAAAPARPAASSSVNPLQTAIATLRSSNPPQTYTTAVTTLEKLLGKIVENPMEEKFRKVKKNNAAFQKRLGGVNGGDDAMKAAGFIVEIENEEEVYMLHASAEKWPQLMAAKTAVEAAVREAKAAASAPPVAGMPTNTSNAATNPFGGTMPGMGAGMGPGMMGADMQGAAARMFSDPNMLQSMLQNPMVQNMMRNDPRFANNPMMQQSMEQLANNPAMLQQVTQMMRDPSMQQQMQAMMSGAGGAGGFGGMNPGAGFGGMPPAFGGAPPAPSQQQQQQSNSGGAGRSDQDQTEEEMIAEAIRRSLEEGGS